MTEVENFGDPFMNREYIELTPYQENNTTN